MPFLPILGCFLTFVVASYCETTQYNPFEPKTTQVPNCPCARAGSTAYDFLLDYNSIIAATDAFQVRVTNFVKELESDKNIFSILILDEFHRFKAFRALLEKENQAAIDKGELYDIYLSDMIKHIYRCATLMNDSEPHVKNSLRNLNHKIRDVSTRASIDVANAIADGKKVTETLQQHLKDLKRFQNALAKATVFEEFDTEIKFLKKIYELELVIKDEVGRLERTD